MGLLERVKYQGLGVGLIKSSITVYVILQLAFNALRDQLKDSLGTQ